MCIRRGSVEAETSGGLAHHWLSTSSTSAKVHLLLSSLLNRSRCLSAVYRRRAVVPPRYLACLLRLQLAHTTAREGSSHRRQRRVAVIYCNFSLRLNKKRNETKQFYFTPYNDTSAAAAMHDGDINKTHGLLSKLKVSDQTNEQFGQKLVQLVELLQVGQQKIFLSTVNVYEQGG